MYLPHRPKSFNCAQPLLHQKLACAGPDAAAIGQPHPAPHAGPADGRAHAPGRHAGTHGVAYHLPVGGAHHTQPDRDPNRGSLGWPDDGTFLSTHGSPIHAAHAVAVCDAYGAAFWAAERQPHARALVEPDAAADEYTDATALAAPHAAADESTDAAALGRAGRRGCVGNNVGDHHCDYHDPWAHVLLDRGTTC